MNHRAVVPWDGANDVKDEFRYVLCPTLPLVIERSLQTKTYHIYKAQPAGDPVESVTVVIDSDFPDMRAPGGAFEMFKLEALTLHRALKALPGGTYDQLLSLMLQEKASHFVVSHFEELPHRTPVLQEEVEWWVKSINKEDSGVT